MSDVYKVAFTDRLRERVRVVSGVCPSLHPENRR